MQIEKEKWYKEFILYVSYKLKSLSTTVHTRTEEIVKGTVHNKTVCHYLFTLKLYCLLFSETQNLRNV